MTEFTADAIVKTCLTQIDAMMKDAASISSAAMVCIEAGNSRRAFQIALDVEPLVIEANTLLQACSALRRRLTPCDD